MACRRATRDYLPIGGRLFREWEYMSDVRKVTNQLLDLAYDGVLSWEYIAIACLQYMSERDVADMASDNYFIDDENDDEAGE